MRFSIIIPIRKITNYLKESIPYLKNIKHSNFEIIIITDEKEDFDFNDSRFKMFQSGSGHPGDKRNIGAKNASGEILAFLDDDAYPDPDWLKIAEEIYKSKDIYALGGPAITPKTASFEERMSGRVLESFLASGDTVYRHVPMTPRSIKDYPTVNFFVKKDAFLSVGGFSKDYWPGEDTKLGLDLVKKYGESFLYDPALLVYHHRRKLFTPHLKQISRYGMHRGQFAKIFPETSRLPFYFVPSFFVIGLLLGPILCTIFGFLWFFYYLVLGLYLGFLFFEGAKVYYKEKSFKAVCYVIAGIFLTNIVYGINFIIGYLKKPPKKLRNFDVKTGNYLGG